MPRSRLHTPSTDKDGNWYKMRGHCADGPLFRWETVSGQMLNDVNKLHRPVTVPTTTELPINFNRRYSRDFSLSNRFSMHDNRNRTQNFGHYFDERLDRQLYPSIDAHNSQADPAFWYSTPAGRRQTMDTTHRYSYRDRNLKESRSNSRTGNSRPWSSSNYKATAGVITQHNKELKINRRFPRNHLEPEEGLKELDTHVAYPNKPHRTFLQTLCSTQEPFLKKNSWKYSYHDVKI
ncbi:uncharacterized protein LOC134851232 isoform X3 [Symsagittifera roscoffensis]|uniref:uncharacterized protein LOC134851232 isoform X1 n=1 Tax=Symsagittifera roscoffensis TaxID=84072 RepID=UPI00307BDD27